MPTLTLSELASNVAFARELHADTERASIRIQVQAMLGNASQDDCDNAYQRARNALNALAKAEIELARALRKPCSDARYSVQLECCGYATPRYVLRFCGEWVAPYETLYAAVVARNDAAAVRALSFAS